MTVRRVSIVRAVSGVDGTTDGRGKHDAPVFLQADEAVTPCRVVGREARAGDRDKPSALCEARQGGSNVADRGIGDAPLDVSCRRKWRVHQNDRRPHIRVEMIVDMRSVVSRERDIRE